MLLQRHFIFSTVLLSILLSSSCYAWQGKVVGVSDGDTITVMHVGKAEKVRLYGVDAPEKHQDFGSKAKQFTSDSVFGKQVQVDPATTDRYGRTVGIVKVDGRCLNEELIKNGFAWVYRQYCDKPMCKNWLKLEKDVRKTGQGLWSAPNPIPPWEFRHPGKKSSQTIAE